MHKFSYLDHKPQIDPSVFVAQGAIIIGRAKLAANVNVWFNCVVRADVNKIEIGTNTNIQDLSMLHVTKENDLFIGANVTVGHSAILHACHVGDGCLIGMGAKVLDGAVIGKNSLVAAGSVVPPGKKYPEGSFIVGSPAKAIRPLDPKEIEMYCNHYKSYVTYKDEYLNSEIVKSLD